MIKNIRKICGYYRESYRPYWWHDSYCWHGISPTLNKCSEENCPFINYFNLIIDKLKCCGNCDNRLPVESGGPCCGKKCNLKNWENKSINDTI